MSNPAIHSRSFPSNATPAFVQVLKELFLATPLYQFMAALKGPSVGGR